MPAAGECGSRRRARTAHDMSPWAHWLPHNETPPHDRGFQSRLASTRERPAGHAHLCAAAFSTPSCPSLPLRPPSYCDPPPPPPILRNCFTRARPAFCHFISSFARLSQLMQARLCTSEAECQLISDPEAFANRQSRCNCNTRPVKHPHDSQQLLGSTVAAVELYMARHPPRTPPRRRTRRRQGTRKMQCCCGAERHASN